MSTAAASSKRCVNCDRDVTSQKRMKDSSGRYWCVTCGEADRLKKGQGADVACSSCGETFAPAQLTKYGAARLCNACYKAATKGPGLRGGLAAGGKTDKGRLMAMVGVMAVLAAGAVWRLMTLHSN